MSIKGTSFDLVEPVYFHREYENDIPKQKYDDTWLSIGQRVGTAALPFLGFCQPLRFPLALTMGGMRTINCACQLFADWKSGTSFDIAFDVAQIAIAVIALAGTVFAHPVGMLVTTGQDLMIELSQFSQHIHAGEYQEAYEDCLKILDNVLYLVLSLYPSLNLSILFLLMQSVVNARCGLREFEKKNYIEAVGHVFMVLVRGRQIGNLMLILEEWRIEESAVNRESIAFHRAIEQGNLQLMEWLYDRGFDINIRNSQGQTALSIARSRSPQLVDWLLAHGAK